LVAALFPVTITASRAAMNLLWGDDSFFSLFVVATAVSATAVALLLRRGRCNGTASGGRRPGPACSPARRYRAAHLLPRSMIGRSLDTEMTTFARACSSAK
jgi:hypothetical protein